MIEQALQLSLLESKRNSSNNTNDTPNNTRNSSDNAQVSTGLEDKTKQKEYKEIQLEPFTHIVEGKFPDGESNPNIEEDENEEDESDDLTQAIALSIQLQSSTSTSSPPASYTSADSSSFLETNLS